MKPKKYEYTIREIDHGDNVKSFVMDLPKEHDVVAIFLNTEVPNFGSWFLEEIDMVLSGKARRRVISGNVCVLDIRKRNTTIDCEFANFGDGDSCKIKTEKLKELILLWFEKAGTFKLKYEQ